MSNPFPRYDDAKAVEVFSRLPKGRVGENDRKYINEVLDAGFGNSDRCDMNVRFELEFARRMGAKYAVSCSNGTVSLQACLMGAGVGPGDEVIVPAISAIATATSVVYCYAVPVFCDVDPETFVMDVDDLRRKITPHTKAIIPVSLFGLPCDMDPIMELAKEYQLTVIEDNAQCYKGYYKGRMAGNLGHAASFSMQGSKHITSGGDGGAVTCSDADYMLRIKRFMGFGYTTTSHLSDAPRTVPRDVRQDIDFRRHPWFGHNFRMSILASALGLAQLERLDDLVEARRIISGLYHEAAAGCKWLTPQRVDEGIVHSCWSYVLNIDESGGVTWREFRRKFVELGGDGLYSSWYPMYLEPVFLNMNFYGDAYRAPNFHPLYKGDVKSYQRGDCPNAERVQRTLLQFKTSFQDYSIAQKQAECLHKTIEYFGR